MIEPTPALIESWNYPGGECFKAEYEAAKTQSQVMINIYANLEQDDRDYFMEIAQNSIDKNLPEEKRKEADKQFKEFLYNCYKRFRDLIRVQE